jgi:hypothetical protein
LIGRAVRAAKDDGDFELPARHVEHLGGGVDNLIGGEDREIESHKLDHGAQAYHRRAHAETCEAEFRDRRINHALLAKLFQQPLRNFVRALISGHFFAEQKHVLIAVHLFAKRLIQSLANRDYSHSTNLQQTHFTLNIHLTVGRTRQRRKHEIISEHSVDFDRLA